MLKKFLIFSFLIFNSCQNFGQFTILADLPKKLTEVSGIELAQNSNLIWMLNDGGNKPILFALSKKGNIKREVIISSKNHDWEDLTSDEKGNIYIGDFGNNQNNRKNLRVLKINKNELEKKNAEVEKIEFEFENQYKFPPKKKDLFFDAEAFFYFKNYLYIFTKSRVKNEYGKTFLYKIPATKGKHIAKLIGQFDNGKENESWITAADISSDGKKAVLLSQKNILVFTDFKDDNFLSGKVKKIAIENNTQKESICFTEKNTLFITDEKAHGKGGFLYELK